MRAQPGFVYLYLDLFAVACFVICLAIRTLGPDPRLACERVFVGALPVVIGSDQEAASAGRFWVSSG